MSKLTPPIRLSARWVIPLFLIAFALMALTVRYNIQLRAIDHDVTAQETRRLRERLNADQSHLDEIRGTDNTLLQRRIVTALGLHEGVTHAYLINADQKIVSSLSRFEIGRTMEELPGTETQALKELAATRPPSALEVIRVAGAPTLLARAPTEDGMLLIKMDLSRPMAQGKTATQKGILRAGVFLLGTTTLLAILLHIFWFRRAQKLIRALTAMGQGDLSTRTGIQGSDELALLGSAADTMAEQLQTSQALVQRLNELVNRSPIVVLEWRAEAGWPMTYVSASIQQWGYSSEEMMDGHVRFSDLIHPEDLDRVTEEVSGYMEHGPDQYQQIYRIRHKNGTWVWVDDRTSLERSPSGKVCCISGILLDITSQKKAEQAQAEQATLLRMFFELPFLGMAISSPKDKRWLQVNDKLCEILGYSRDELLSKSWAEMTPPGDLERNVALFDELVAGQRNHYQMEKRFVRKDGAIVHTEIDVRAVRDNQGAVTHLFATIQDVTARKQADEALRNSEKRLREAQRIGSMGSFERDLTTDEAKWSDEMYRIHEMDPTAGKPSVEAFLQLVIEEDRPLVTGAIQSAIEDGGIHESAYRIVLADGRVKHLRARAALEEIDGLPAKLTGTVLDVTNQTVTRLALQESESLLEEAQRAAQLGYASTDLLSGKTVWSPEFYRQLGLDPATDEASTEAFMQMVHPDDRERLRNAIGQTKNTPSEASFCIDHRIVVEGVVHHMETRGHFTFDSAGQAIRLHGTSMDITERKQAEMGLHDHQEMLEQAEELVQLGSWVVDVNNRRLTISDQLFRNIGLEPSDRNPTEEAYLARIHPDDRAMVAADVERVRSDLPTGELIFRTDPAWGPMRWLRRTIRRMPAAGDRGPRIIGTLLDISEAVHAQENLKQVNEELEQRVVERTEQLTEANRELEAFSYTVSHDLKAPLRGIDGYSQLLLEEYGAQLGDDGSQFVQRIRQGVGQMGDLISDLLEYSRMERRDMVPAPMALRPLIEQIVASHIGDIERLGVQVDLTLDDVTLPLDREGIAVVLRNLIGNALKFSQGNSAPRIEIGGRSEAGRRILWVRDNGVGFDMAYHDRIFNIFQRLHRSEEFPGTGVGLALVAKAVQRMGGRVWAESTLGVGATFFLEFAE